MTRPRSKKTRKWPSQAFLEMVGDNGRRFRKARGWTQQEVAVRMGVKKAFISHLENGRQNFTSGVLEHWAYVLGVLPRDLVDPPER